MIQMQYGYLWWVIHPEKKIYAAPLSHDSVKIQAKALWLLGEMGLVYPMAVQDTVPVIASFLCLGAIRATEPEVDDLDDIHDPCLRFQK